jgi:alkylation response protein AidB-like acyl-CoA dehydrogenase
MNLLPDEDQESIRATAREMLSTAFGAPRAHEFAAGADLDSATWVGLADMGWFGLGVDEDAGGPA